MLLENKYHLTYCTNIHPGQDWESTLNSLKEYVPGIKSAVSPDQPFGLGLRLSNKASEELAKGNRMNEFKKWLQDQDVYIFTMNGFPYGNFHNERVKDDVHTPDWTTKERLAYTQRLFHQLAELIPEGINGGISTSPISYKHWFKSEVEKQAAFKKGAKQMLLVAKQLFELEKSTGKYLHLDIEPEPDGFLENTDEVLSFYKDYLFPAGRDILAKDLNLDPDELENLVRRYITICYDICHFSLAYEEPTETFKKFKQAGIQIGKIQVSAALKILFEQGDNQEVWDLLEKFNEPTYLHQVTEKSGDGVKTYNDLPVVLEKKNSAKELRAHFHVPIFLEQFEALYSTQDQILKTLEYLRTDPISEHLEIETYTWDVLPEALKENLSSSIIREINWLKSHL
ncbi:metabolite traffic protein EboE [Maribacter cobaltidurans]|uniref:Xylose isomerase n=1 Tax=Maribacter cobaltidurans TaxID=1178778 RepID=A0A223V7Q3_9FLAO|nr:metabolite traffic protein EboE [Maribacter cobaltidurans]ASV31435.1 xylose isomerase [Maribacter cobaltidurans]GGD82275.1 sugar phosphate isomerase [Maribacter cobaltidurans]